MFGLSPLRIALLVACGLAAVAFLGYRVILNQRALSDRVHLIEQQQQFEDVEDDQSGTFEEYMDQDEEEDETYDTHEDLCPWVLASGVRKGVACGRRILDGLQYCKLHSRVLVRSEQKMEVIPELQSESDAESDEDVPEPESFELL